MTKKLLLLVQFLIISNINNIAIAIDLKNIDEQISYSLGFMAAEHAKSKSPLGIKINPDSFIQGFKDNFKNKQQLDQEQIIKSLNIIREKQLELQKKYMDKNSTPTSSQESTIPPNPPAPTTTAVTPPAPPPPAVGSQIIQTPSVPNTSDVNNLPDNNLLINTIQDINPKEISKNKFLNNNKEQTMAQKQTQAQTQTQAQAQAQTQNKDKNININQDKNKDLAKSKELKEIKSNINNNPIIATSLTNNHTTINSNSKTTNNIASNNTVISEELAKPKEFINKIVKELDKNKHEKEKTKENGKEKENNKEKSKKIAIEIIQPKMPDAKIHEKNIAKINEKIDTNTIANKIAKPAEKTIVDTPTKPATNPVTKPIVDNPTKPATNPVTKPIVDNPTKQPTINPIAKSIIDNPTKPTIKTNSIETKTIDLNKSKLLEKSTSSNHNSINKEATTTNNNNKIKENNSSFKELAKLQEILQSKESKKESSAENNKEHKKTQDKISNEINNINLVKNFLQTNKKNKGINELKSGLQYLVLNAGNQSAKSPLIHDKVKVHYRGTLLNGKEFDNSYNKNPAIFELKSVIKGWQEALTLMKPNAKWKIFVPPQLAYGNKEIGNIPANSILIFEVELIEVNPR